MIQFRCWYCNKSYAVAERRIGERLICSCERRLGVPSRSGGRCRDRSLVDWIVEAIVYGGGGGLLGFGLAVLILSKLRFRSNPLDGWVMVLSCTLIGFLAGALGGEAGVNWIGRMIRKEE